MIVSRLCRERPIKDKLTFYQINGVEIWQIFSQNWVISDKKRPKWSSVNAFFYLLSKSHSSKSRFLGIGTNQLEKDIKTDEGKQEDVGIVSKFDA